MVTPFPSVGYAPLSWRGQLTAYIDWLAYHHYSALTQRNRTRDIGRFIVWAEERGVSRPQEVTAPIVERYQRYLYLYRKDNGQPLSVSNQRGCLSALRLWYRWLVKERRVLYNPAAEITLPRSVKRLPRAVLTASEAEQVLLLPDTSDELGLRDRAMLEVLYSTGMRRQELIDLSIHSIDAGRGCVSIVQGKGNKDRMIPIGQRALRWVERYRDRARPELALGRDSGHLFLTVLGDAFTPSRMTQLVAGYVKAAELGKTGSCHLFRHTMATLMLENGADIRHIQAMLGHAVLSTTEIYTQVSVKLLQRIHRETHPAGLGRPKEADIDEVEAAELWAELEREAREEDG